MLAKLYPKKNRLGLFKKLLENKALWAIKCGCCTIISIVQWKNNVCHKCKSTCNFKFASGYMEKK